MIAYLALTSPYLLIGAEPVGASLHFLDRRRGGNEAVRGVRPHALGFSAVCPNFKKRSVRPSLHQSNSSTLIESNKSAPPRGLPFFLSQTLSLSHGLEALESPTTEYFSLWKVRASKLTRKASSSVKNVEVERERGVAVSTMIESHGVVWWLKTSVVIFLGLDINLRGEPSC